MKHLFHRFYRASSLLYALIVVAVLAMISLAFISLSGYQRMLFERDGLQARLNRHCVSGMDLLLNDSEVGAKKNLVTLGVEQEDSLLLQRYSWGFFDVALVRAWRKTTWRTEIAQQIGLIGLIPDSIGKSAIYLQDDSGPLTLVGNTRLRGRAYLPGGNARSGYINTTGFLGIKLVDGLVLGSNRTMPRLWEDRLVGMQQRFLGISRQVQLGTRADRVPAQLQASFSMPEIILAGKTISINRQQLTGHVMIVADSLIVVGKNAVLSDVVLIAPEIVIDSGFVGTVQAIATQKIQVSNRVQLAYPSVLSVIRLPDDQHPLACSIGENCSINGFVITWNNSNTIGNYPKMTIGHNSVVHGEVYADGSLELYGEIEGHVTCRSFILQTAASIYINYLMDAVIDVEKRPKAFVGTILTGKEPAVVKWMHDVQQPAPQ